MEAPGITLLQGFSLPGLGGVASRLSSASALNTFLFGSSVFLGFWPKFGARCGVELPDRSKNSRNGGCCIPSWQVSWPDTLSYSVLGALFSMRKPTDCLVVLSQRKALLPPPHSVSAAVTRSHSAAEDVYWVHSLGFRVRLLGDQALRR